MYLVECKPDAILIKTLTLTPRKNIEHAGNKTELLKKLAERYTNSKGIIDEDPLSIQPPHLNRFKEKQDLTPYNIKILHQPSRNNTLIILRPRLEDWILEAAQETNTNLKKYKLPDDPTRLHEQINIQIDKFQKLVEDIEDQSKRLKELKKHLTGT
jgi:hypothetical protein